MKLTILLSLAVVCVLAQTPIARAQTCIELNNDRQQIRVEGEAKCNAFDFMNEPTADATAADITHDTVRWDWDLARLMVEGKWTGSYICEVSIGVSVEFAFPVGDDTVIASFDFFPLDSVNYPWSIKEGSYRLLGTVKPKPSEMSFKPDVWLKKTEPGQVMAGFNVNFVERNGERFLEEKWMPEIVGASC